MLWGWFGGGFLLIVIGFIAFVIAWISSMIAATHEDHTGLVVLLIFVPIIGVPVTFFLLEHFWLETPAEYAARKEREQKRSEARAEAYRRQAPERERKRKEYKQRAEQAEQERLAELADPTPLWITILDAVHVIACFLFFFATVVLPIILAQGRGGGVAHGGFWIFFLPTVMIIVATFCVKLFQPAKSRKWDWFFKRSFILFIVTGSILVVIILFVTIGALRNGNFHIFELVPPEFDGVFGPSKYSKYSK